MKRIYGVGIGSSTGGLPALYEFFDNLPGDTGAVYFIITHIPPQYRSILGELIQKHTTMPVIRVTQNMAVEINTIYVLIENTMMELNDNHLYMRKRHVWEVINRAIDIFFDSLAMSYKEYAIGVILSGHGCDGAKGVKKITEMGGKILVQSPETSLAQGMPFAAINNDHPIAIQSPAELAKNIVHLLQNHRAGH